MYHIGIGPTQLNNFLSVLNLPLPSHKTIQRRCEEVGSTLEMLACESADKALQKEVELSTEVSPLLMCADQSTGISVTASSDPTIIIEVPAQGEFPETATLPIEKSTSSTDYHEITASADGAYQRRGSGRCHNSLSGAASLIGKKTGKVIAYTARYKRCRICDKAKVKKRQPRQHRCRKNWRASAKAMEPDMVVEMLKSTKKKKAVVANLIGDDDTTAFNRARQEVCPTMEKVSDKNHVKKNISSQLYKLKPKYKELSVKTINALMKGFSYMLSQAKGDKDYIKEGLQSVVLHQFGDHNHCNTWCSISKDPTRKHKNLPWGVDLADVNLKHSLLAVFNKLDPEKLCKLDSSNSNASFNNTLRSKAPKDKHYSDGGSMAHRLSAAVCQKNEGYGYVSTVNKKLGLSPGESTVRRAIHLDKDVRRKKEKSKTKDFKLRRLQLKGERSAQTKSCEVREGETYLSNVLGRQTEPDTEKIPGPDAQNISDEEHYAIPTTNSEINLDPQTPDSIQREVFYDLETTGLGRGSCITQLSARYKEEAFNRFLTPTMPISPEASKVTGIVYDETTNVMTHHHKIVSHVNSMNGLLDFLHFLTIIGRNIILIAHNNKKFDCIILYNHLKHFKLWSHFCKLVTGFADTLPFFRKLYPEFPNHKQETLVERLLREDYSAHDASEDCLYLQKLVFHSGNSALLFTEFMFSPAQITSSGVQAQEMSVDWLCQIHVVSRHMATKLKNSSLTYHHLKLAYERDGYDGVYFLLSEKDIAGKTRITKSRNVIKKIEEHFQTHRCNYDCCYSIFREL